MRYSEEGHEPVVQKDAIIFSVESDEVKELINTWALNVAGMTPDECAKLSAEEYRKKCEQFAAAIMHHVGRDPTVYETQWRAATERFFDMKVFQAKEWSPCNQLRTIRDKVEKVDLLARTTGADFCLVWTDICVLLALRIRQVRGGFKDKITKAIDDHFLFERAAASIDAYNEHPNEVFQVQCMEGLSFHDRRMEDIDVDVRSDTDSNVSTPLTPASFHEHTCHSIPNDT